ncbi:BspA type Leucine rich repeat region (6 copies) [Popillia japonica]|uniref:BspA type Leucine rich repeat region (6 copies) n=1 Tax=Popillia japonica TaxID=7064 RepID=A0AAW1MK44_POPJA
MHKSVIVVATAVCIVSYSSCTCPNTFNNALLELHYGIVYKGHNTTFNGCVRGNSDITRIVLRTPTMNIFKGTFSNLTVLDYLALDNANLHVIEAQFAENLPKLRTFSASMNQIREIGYNVLNNLPLKNIYLSINTISEIANGAFSGMDLVYLHLNNNELHSINSNWFLNTTIKGLYLSSNHIELLWTETFSGIIGMETLDLGRNKIHYIDCDTFSTQRSLESLFMKGNSLLNLDFDIGSNLQVLDVSFNMIFSTSLERMTNVEAIIILPNPWVCKCLEKLVNESKLLNIKIMQRVAERTQERLNAPICVVADTTCGNNVAPVNTVHREYFRRVHYAKIIRYWVQWRSYPHDFENRNITFKRNWIQCFK